MTHDEIFSFSAPLPTQPLEEPFVFSVIGAAHGHIYGMCRGLIEQGARLKAVYDQDPAVAAGFARDFPEVEIASAEDSIYDDPEIRLIVCAAVPVRRAEVGVRAMMAGKDFFVDKAPMITLEQVGLIRKTCSETGQKCFIFYGESIANESTVFSLDLIRRGVIGDVFHINGTAPHRLNALTRPDWFFRRSCTGGILTDLVCHQLHQFLEFADANTAAVDFSRVANYNHPQFPELDDFGDLDCTASNGITGHLQVDWFTPDGLRSWGDSRMVIQGTKGTIELRKNCDIARDSRGSNVYVVTEDGEFYENVTGKVSMPFFPNLIRDCINRTETAMNPQRALHAIELSIRAQTAALQRKG